MSEVSGMDDPYERYYHDHEFKSLVDSIHAMLHRAEFTPLEVRQAAVVACVKFEETRKPPFYLHPDQLADMKRDFEEAQLRYAADHCPELLKELQEGTWPKQST